MITSHSNDTIRAIRKLEESKYRKSTGLFLAEGLRVVAQAFDSGADVEQLIFSPSLLVSEFGQGLVEKASALDVSLVEVSEAVFTTLSRKDTPQGIAAVIKQKWLSLSEVSPKIGDLWVGLQAVQNPGNLGTILRTCDAVGANGLILLDHSTDPYDPVAVKASMGSIFTVPLVKTTFPQFSTWHQAHPELSLIGTSDKARKDCFTNAYPPTCLVLMGSEGKGLPSDYLELCQETVRIPMEGACDSLNLAVATGIILYQVYHQRRT
ncbi:MAG: TrmH family RNA methyltransferase [Anaerolineaceae bacterium]|jgi:TrmH family RNA methyltransferase